MTRYFMRDTPLQQIEQQMMTPPNFKPRGHGLYQPGFRYISKDVDCRYCTNYNRKYPCTLTQCMCLRERIEAGTLDLTDFIHDCLFSEARTDLQERLHKHFSQFSFSFFLNDTHRKRWLHWHYRYSRMTDRSQSALFLLTAYDELWRRVIWKFDSDGFDFQSIQLSSIQPELYSVYQAAKAIAIGSRNITTADLASPELVTDEAFQLIICALLLAKYGDVILNLERKTGDIKQ